eukprot:COSAG02_NODE_745_length_17738_cov_18.178241_6_plen_709_part_00
MPDASSHRHGHGHHDTHPQAHAPNARLTFKDAPGSGSASPRHSQRKDYQSMFNKYDTNRSGSLNEQELRKMLDELGLGVASTELDDLIKTIPTNDNKEVEFEQFFSAMQTGASAVFGSMQQNIEEKIFGRHETWDGEVEELTEASKNHCCGLAHPLAKRRQVYDMVQLCLLCYTLYSVPLQIAFSEEAQLNSPVFWIDFIIWMAFMADLPIQANTFYQYSRTGEWITDKSKIRKRYCKSWLVVDVVAVFPIDYILRWGHYMSQANSGPEVAAGSTRMLRLARLFRYLRLLKLMSAGPLINDVFEKVQEVMGFSRQTVEFIIKMANLVVVVYSFNHLAGCMWIFVGRTHSGLVEPPFPDPPEEAWWDTQYGDMFSAGLPVTPQRQYIDAMYFVMMTLTSVGYGDITPKNESEKWYCYILMYCTAFVYAYVIGVFADMVASRRMDRNKFDMKMRQVFEFLKHCECPEELQASAKRFYDHRFPRKTVFDEQSIYDELPPRFTKALVLHRFERAVHSVPFFRTASDECVVDICREFRSMPAQAGDAILLKGDHNHELIILEHGEAVGTQGTVDTAYKPGSFFGEMEFLGLTPGSLCQYTITAVTDCDLYTLRFADIGHVLVEFPEMQVQLTQYAEMRQKALQKLQGQSSGGAEVEEPDNANQTSPPSLLQQKTYDLATASEEMRRCSRADLQAAILRGVLSQAISLHELRDL